MYIESTQITRILRIYADCHSLDNMLFIVIGYFIYLRESL
jgi:hypothetical protein